MAQPVQYTVDDLLRKVAELLMEVTMRSRREDQMAKEIASLRVQLEEAKAK